MRIFNASVIKDFLKIVDSFDPAPSNADFQYMYDKRFFEKLLTNAPCAFNIINSLNIVKAIKRNSTQIQATSEKELFWCEIPVLRLPRASLLRKPGDVAETTVCHIVLVR